MMMGMNIKINNQMIKIYHKFTSAFIFTAILMVVVHAYSQETLNLLSEASHLPYQAHSYNDLGIAKHLLLKGVKYFKFDISLADRLSCSKYSNWDGKNKCFNSSHYVDEICCVAMRGDAGSQNNFYYQFNTSDEFIQLFQTFFKEHGAAIKFLFVAIDFQFSFELNNHLVQNFVYQLGQLTVKYKNLHIAIAQDFILSYDKLCRDGQTQSRELIAGDQCTSTRKAISDSLIVLQSSSNHPYDSRDYKGRYRNFNIYYKEVDRLCRDGFPTWPNKYPEYPLIFWQPSNEDQIQGTLRKLLSPACAKKHNRSIEGVAFASNIDPEMFQIYAKEINQKDMAGQFPWDFKNKKMWIEGAVSIKLAKLVGVTANSQERLVVSWRRQELGQLKNYLSLFWLNEQTNMISVEKTIELQSQVKELHSVNDRIFVVLKNDDSTSKEFEAVITSYTPKLEKIKSRIISSYIISYASSSMIYYISRTSNINYFNLYQLTPDLSNSTQYSVSTFMSKTQLDSLTSIYFKKGQTLDDDVFLTFGNVENQAWIGQIKYGNIHKEKTLTYGINPNIIDKQDGNILISLEASYSHSGLLLNNNAENKCRLHQNPASQRLAHLPHLVNIIEGSFADLMEFLNQDSQQIITACHPKLVFSKHLNGGQVDIASVWNNVFISTKYVSINSLDFMEAVFTGGSNYQYPLRQKTGFLLTSVNGNRKFNSEAQRQDIVQYDQK